MSKGKALKRLVGFNIFAGGAYLLAKKGLPALMKSAFREMLLATPDFTGTIGTIDVSLLTGEIVIKDVSISQRLSSGAVEPLFSAKKIASKLDFNQLVQGKLSTATVMHSPHIRLWGKKSPDLTKSAPIDARVLNLLPQWLLPLVSYSEIRNGTLEVLSIDEDPTLNLIVSEVESKAMFAHDKEGVLVPDRIVLETKGNMMGTGAMKSRLEIMPRSVPAEFSLHASIGGMDMVGMNSFVRKFNGIDFADGIADMDLAVSARESKFAGQIDMNAQDLGFKDETDAQSGTVQSIKEGIAEVATKVMLGKNRSVNPQIGLSGTLDPKASLPEALGTVAWQALVSSLAPQKAESATIQKAI